MIFQLKLKEFYKEIQSKLFTKLILNPPSLAVFSREVVSDEESEDEEEV